jgi:hypothetical protein
MTDTDTDTDTDDDGYDFFGDVGDVGAAFLRASWLMTSAAWMALSVVILSLLGAWPMRNISSPSLHVSKYKSEHHYR